MAEATDVLIFLGISALLKYTLFYKWHSRVPRSSELVGRVSKLMIYPVKSMSGVSVESAQCTSGGLACNNVRDRNWIVAKKQPTGYKFVTARQEPKLMQAQPSFHHNCLQLDAPGLKPIKLQVTMEVQADKVVTIEVFDETIQGVDCGDDAANWLNDLLGKDGCRLYFCPPSLKRRYVVDGATKWHKRARPDDTVTYQDGWPFMMLSDASIQDLNTRLKNQVGMERFRPNILASGCRAFAEDFWEDMTIGNSKFTNVVPCDRCHMTTVIPEKAKRDPENEPLKTLRSYRLLLPELGDSPCFGRMLLLEQGNRISVGDKIYARTSDAVVA